MITVVVGGNTEKAVRVTATFRKIKHTQQFTRSPGYIILVKTFAGAVGRRNRVSVRSHNKNMIVSSPHGIE